MGQPPFCFLRDAFSNFEASILKIGASLDVECWYLELRSLPAPILSAPKIVCARIEHSSRSPNSSPNEGRELQSVDRKLLGTPKLRAKEAEPFSAVSAASMTEVKC
jgi:hypothetical protein